MGKRLLTASRIKSFRACPRLHDLSYVQGYRAAKDARALTFGTRFHELCEVYWLARGGYWGLVWLKTGIDLHAKVIEPFDAVMSMFDKLSWDDPWMRVQVLAMITAYASMWDTLEVEDVLGVEVQFETPFRNPHTGEESPAWNLAGKLDVVVRLRDGRVAIIEHKTSGQNAGVGSEYRSRLTLDGQVSTYVHALEEAFGIRADVVIYDVVQKPLLRPYEAVAPDKIRYKKNGEAYANQRTKAETAEEFFDRICADMLEQPTRYLHQIEVVRLDSQRAEIPFDLWAWSEMMLTSERDRVSPMNPDACFRYGSPCWAWAHCSGGASLDDPSLFRKLKNVSPELEEKEEGAE